MTQAAKRPIPAGKIALAVAALAAASAVGYAAWTGRAEAPLAVAEGADAGEPVSIEALEAKTRADPDDPGPWAALGFAYFAQGSFDDAARAYERASGLDPDKSILWSALGEARVMASRSDPMPPAALAAFRKAVALDPKDPRARYFLAVKRDLGGDHRGALDDWLALLEDTPPDAPWRSDLVRTIEQVAKINAIDVAARIDVAGKKSPAAIMPVAARAIPGPNAADLRNAAAIPPGEQREMAEGMVARLESRLQGNPGNVEGWIMLMRSRMTLGEPDKATAALRAAVAANPDQAAELRQQARILGVK